MSQVETRLLGWLAETPVHAGTGQTSGAIDLPIQREGHTGYPTIAASGLKGALRQAAETDSDQAVKDCVKAWFGPETADTAGGSGYAGCIAFSDARLVGFPVRSLWDVFVWITSPWALGRLQRDFDRAGGNLSLSLPEIDRADALVPKGSGAPDTVVVEDVTLKTQQADLDAVADALCRFVPVAAPFDAVAARLRKRLLVLSDADYAYLVKNACPVSARNVLTKEKTSSNLWYEESLPPESLLYSLAIIDKPRSDDAKCPSSTAGDVSSQLAKWVERRGYFQVGGNETVGEGWCRVVVTTAGGKP